MSLAIKVENLSKMYQIGEIGTGTISRDIERWARTKILKQEDPFLKIGEANDRSKAGNSNVVYSLKDINFEIEQGDAVGIIGRNGAGKSTLLKLLSRVTSPTTGRIGVKGRIASLLEVGTGFHPELSGRENIYLNGAILGMRKKEIDRKLDEIIDFSGVERYIDTPVKRYSSGMYVRLAFAVAAHLESEILIVDEVLAVGDAEFQKKCLGKMGEVSKGEGRTVLFVSHNMAAVQSLCEKGILLGAGQLLYQGLTNQLISNYMSSNQIVEKSISGDIIKKSEFNAGIGFFRRILIKNRFDEPQTDFAFLEPVTIFFEFESFELIENVVVSIIINDQFENSVLMGTVGEFYERININKGLTKCRFIIKENLMPGMYSVTLSMAYFFSGYAVDYNENVARFAVEYSTKDGKNTYPWHTVHGKIKPQNQISIIS
jgi:lipopolysaccharide transport system ATP-binding protein